MGILGSLIYHTQLHPTAQAMATTCYRTSAEPAPSRSVGLARTNSNLPPKPSNTSGSPTPCSNRTFSNTSHLRNPLEPSSCWRSGLPQPTPEPIFAETPKAYSTTLGKTSLSFQDIIGKLQFYFEFSLDVQQLTSTYIISLYYIWYIRFLYVFISFSSGPDSDPKSH